MKSLIPAAIVFAAVIIGFAQLNAAHTEQEEAAATAATLLDAQADARRAVAEARIDAARPPLPVIHVYDADEGDECEGDKCKRP